MSVWIIFNVWCECPNASAKIKLISLNRSSNQQNDKHQNPHDSNAKIHLPANGVCSASNAYRKKKYTFQIFLIHNVLRMMLLVAVLLLDQRIKLRFSDRENTPNVLQSICSFTSTNNPKQENKFVVLSHTAATIQLFEMSSTHESRCDFL